MAAVKNIVHLHWSSTVVDTPSHYLLLEFSADAPINTPAAESDGWVQLARSDNAQSFTNERDLKACVGAAAGVQFTVNGIKDVQFTEFSVVAMNGWTAILPLLTVTASGGGSRMGMT